MKSLLFNIRNSMAILFFLLPFIYGDCGGNRDYNVGYHYVTIPSFTDSDYVHFLDSSNTEMQYNAICYLYDSKSLPSELDIDSLKGTHSYDSALALYKKIYPFIFSENSWVSSAAIRYFKGVNYNNKKFQSDISKISDPSVNIQLEIANVLKADTISDETLLLEKYRFFRHQASWLLQNSAYGLLKGMDHLLADELMVDYKNNTAEYKRLLILKQLFQHIDDTVFAFLANEYSRTGSAGIREYIFTGLRNAENQELAYHWYMQHVETVMQYMPVFVNGILSEDDISGRIVVLAIQHGWKPSSLVETENDKTEVILYELLYLGRHDEYWTDSSRKIFIEKTKGIEEEIMKRPALKREWMDFQAAQIEYTLPDLLVLKHDALTREYLQKTKALFLENGIDTSNASYFMEQVRSEEDRLYKKKYKK